MNDDGKGVAKVVVYDMVRTLIMAALAVILVMSTGCTSYTRGFVQGVASSITGAEPNKSGIYSTGGRIPSDLLNDMNDAMGATVSYEVSYPGILWMKASQTKHNGIYHAAFVASVTALQAEVGNLEEGFKGDIDIILMTVGGDTVICVPGVPGMTFNGNYPKAVQVEQGGTIASLVMTIGVMREDGEDTTELYRELYHNMHSSGYLNYFKELEL
jgi:hypothetical protein